MTLNITDKEAMVLKSLIIQEIDFLDNEIKQEKREDKKELIEELNACNEILTKLNSQKIYFNSFIDKGKSE